MAFERKPLVDEYGHPIDVSRLTAEEAAPSLTGTRSILAGHPSIGLTPHRLASILLEAENAGPTNQLELAEDMEEKDLHYRGVLTRRKLGIAQLEMNVVAASDSAEDVAAADLVRSVVDRGAFQNELFDILDAIGKGYSVTEIIWETSARQWVPRCLKWRDPRWFLPDREDGHTLLLRDGAQLVPLTPYKYLVHRPKLKSGLPIRGGLARAAAWSYLFKNYALKDWVSFAEVFGQPYRVGKYQAGATPQDKAALLRAVANIGSDAAAIIPQSMMIEFIEASRTGSLDLYEQLCRFLDEQVSKHVLGQTTTTEVTGGGGSRALGDVHDKTYREIQRADAGQLSETLTRDLVRPLVDLNLGPRAKYPRIVVGLPDELTTLQKIAALNILVPMGLKVDASAVRTSLGYAKPAADAELLAAASIPAANLPADIIAQAQRARAAADALRQLHQRTRRIAAGAEDASSLDAIDQLTADALRDDGWQQMLVPELDPITALLQDASSLEDVRARLPELVPAMSLDHFTTLLANSEFTARLAGALGIGLEDAPGEGGHGDA